LLHERYGITDPDALKFRFFAGVSNQMFTRQEPLNNVVRATLACLGLVLGGAQAITVIGYDEAYDIPSEEAQLVALRTQQIMAYETHLSATVDPLAGSYYVEAITDETEERVRAFMTKIDEQAASWPRSRAGAGTARSSTARTCWRRASPTATSRSWA